MISNEIKIKTKLQGGPKRAHFALYALTSSNIDRFSNVFHSRYQENTCNNNVTKDPNTHRMCRYPTLSMSVLKAT